MARVAYGTCRPMPGGDEDLPLLEEALAELGVALEPAVWDDPAVDWDGFDLVLVRSIWDYTGRRDEFLAWADAVPRLANPADLVRWNTDKRYLQELSAQDGVPIVPTTFVGPGDPVPALEGEVVVKPCVSAGGEDAGRFGPADHDAARAHVQALTGAGRHVMVQPFLSSVDEQGETAVFCFGGEVSHGLRKGQVLSPGGVAPLAEGMGDGIRVAASMLAEDLMAPRDPSAAERALARQVLDAVERRFGVVPPYARVDCVTGPEGTPVLMELEATEPSLYLGLEPAAPARFAAAIAAHLRALGR